jgi:hypothetical protein
MTASAPLNDLETVLLQARAGEVPVSRLMQMLVEAELAVPSAGEVMPDGGGFRPVLFPKEQVQMLAAFTDRSRIGTLTDLAPYCLTMKGRDLLKRMPPGCGIVINPGSTVGFDIAPDGIRRILDDFGRPGS